MGFFFQHEHPYISAMVNNGSLHYDHDRDGTHTSLAGCEAKFRNKDYDTFVAIRYQDNALRVRHIVIIYLLRKLTLSITFKLAITVTLGKKCHLE